MNEKILTKDGLTIFSVEKDGCTPEILFRYLRKVAPDIQKVFAVSLRFGSSEKLPNLPGLTKALELATENPTNPVILFGTWLDHELKEEGNGFYQKFINMVNTGYLLEPFGFSCVECVLQEISQKMLD